MISLWWLRRDLRLDDNPALRAACQHGSVVPIYIHSPEEEAPWTPGAASNWWLHHSLAALADELCRLGNCLVIRRGDSLENLRRLVRETGASAVYWNRLYEPASIARDRRVKAALREQGITVHSHNAALWVEPWKLSKADGQPYRVFTPFWKHALRPKLEQALPGNAPDSLGPAARVESLPLEALALTPRINWDVGLQARWQPGEATAQARLLEFLETDLPGYTQGRDQPGLDVSSNLSAALHFGELSPQQVYFAVQQRRQTSALLDTAAEKFLSELGWREFAHHLLFHFPHSSEDAFNPRYLDFPWREPDTAELQAWQHGRTGIPIVDAGMRELWHTGVMHNRVRMLVASLLTKNLRAHWLHGARWFWDTLVDADLASNTLGWQWVAGCGADAAPYFRIFNPVLQAQRFDPEGVYIRRWLPELARLPLPDLYAPWLARAEQLQKAGVVMGQTYPLPIVDLKASRAAALDALQQVKMKQAVPLR